LLQAEHPDIPWRLVIAGEGPDSAALQSLSEQSGLADRVEFPGYLVGEQLDAAYRAASVFVLPSYAEGFPTVVTEAMAAGLPIVATSIRGLIDYLEDGVNALFVEPRDALGLYHALARLLQDEDLRRSMGRANRERVKIFEPDAVGSRYLSTLEAILARPDHS
jgi:glycosyltransferase involved in cell wall biosynthesis